jgi:hypothetical protein
MDVQKVGSLPFVQINDAGLPPVCVVSHRLIFGSLCHVGITDMEMTLPSTHFVGPTVRPIGQSRNARWMRWLENRWHSSTAQMIGMSPDIERSRSTHATWRNGVIPDGDTILDLVAAYPSLNAVFWPEQVKRDADTVLSQLDALEEAIAQIRSVL